MLLLWLAILSALSNHLMVQTCGLLKYVVDASPNGECAGWTKGSRTSSSFNVRTLVKVRFRTEISHRRADCSRNAPFHLFA